LVPLELICRAAQSWQVQSAQGQFGCNAAREKTMPTLLVVDDDPSILFAFKRAFRDPALKVLTAETASEGFPLAREHKPDVVVLDIQLPDLPGPTPGLEMLRRLRELDARSPVIFITGRSTTDTAIEAMKLGAYEYLLKPLELPVLRQVVDKALAVSRQMHVPAVITRDEQVDDRADAIIGACPAMQEVYKAIGRVAAQDMTVLITGETGTGKELVARALYQHSRRAAGPFLAINCAAIPETLLESELFGHEKGAFTGADRRRIGKFEQCSGGTLFLDEVIDMSPLTQSKILRLLQEGRFERLGGNETIHADVRVLAATNGNLAEAVAEGRFRQDLYYRLNVCTIHLPPLRSRGSDLDLLVRHYVRRYSREMGKDVQSVAPQTLEVLHGYSWQGNVRELQSIIKQALLQAAGLVLLPDFLPPGLDLATATAPEGADGADPGLEQFIDAHIRAGGEDLYKQAVERLERTLLTRVLRHTKGNQVQAARILGITRGSLRTKVRELGIRIERTISGEPDDAREE
jgi:two-component system nitrogen regulation response regulator GlnG